MAGKESTDSSMKLKLFERETIINFNEAEDEARVNTFNARLIKKARQLSEQNRVKIEFKGRGEGEVEFYLPKRLITFITPRPYSGEEKARRQAIARRTFHEQSDTSR